MTFAYTSAMAPSSDLADPPPLVSTSGGVRTLAFLPGEVQSEMRLSRPAELMLAYSRAMMCFALFVPRPRHILMVGLAAARWRSSATATSRMRASPWSNCAPT